MRRLRIHLVFMTHALLDMYVAVDIVDARVGRMWVYMWLRVCSRLIIGDHVSRVFVNVNSVSMSFAERNNR